MDINTQWRVIHGVVACFGAILLIWSLIWADWFGVVAVHGGGG